MCSKSKAELICLDQITLSEQIVVNNLPNNPESNQLCFLSFSFTTIRIQPSFQIDRFIVVDIDNNNDGSFVYTATRL